MDPNVQKLKDQVLYQLLHASFSFKLFQNEDRVHFCRSKESASGYKVGQTPLSQFRDVEDCIYIPVTINKDGKTYEGTLCKLYDETYGRTSFDLLDTVKDANRWYKPLTEEWIREWNTSKSQTDGGRYAQWLETVDSLEPEEEDLFD